MPSLTVNPDGKPHTHEFVRIPKTNTFRCAHPHCFTVYHKKYLKGKESLCGICHEAKIILGYEELRRAIPRCNQCSGTVEALRIKYYKDILKDMGV